jgi:hypothetical protein
MLRCESRWLPRDDETRLLVAATAVLPSSVEPHVSGRCRNPDGARAWISTHPIKTPQDVRQWWQFTCRREKRDWECDQPEFNQLVDIKLVVGGTRRHVELSFDKDVSLDRAQSLSSEALALYADPRSRLHWCSENIPLDSDWETVRRRNPLPAGNRPIRINVYFDGDVGAVAFTDVRVEVRLSPGIRDTPGSPIACWNQWIVVT